ncbi:SDR family NAD(P)-dependent oxidoreductase [Pseudonocardia halophobica]|uniref:SDR family NAD(P)-dependent oxidoreductase n=1 Tax=Pseudonocardia halophobica TaxID=29401 RepID=UPI0018CC59E3|nr:SDR family oxidoreductase [Pseudonocardia halophobica]
MLLTGAGSGIGRALALEFAQAGAHVAATDVDDESAAETARAVRAAGGVARSYALDVTDDAWWSAVVARVERDLGPIDVLASNAGSSSSRRELTELSVEYLRWLFDVNVLGAVRGIRAVVPGMRARGRGSVLFTGSMAGLWVGRGGADYSATKHALLAVADSLRNEVAGDGVRVSILCPSAVPTRLAETTRSRAVEPAAVPDPTRAAEMATLVAETGGMVSAEEVARISLEGLRDGRFYIFTHAGSGTRFLERSAEIARELARLDRGSAVDTG